MVCEEIQVNTQGKVRTDLNSAQVNGRSGEKRWMLLQGKRGEEEGSTETHFSDYVRVLIINIQEFQSLPQSSINLQWELCVELCPPEGLASCSSTGDKKVMLDLKIFK